MRYLEDDKMTISTKRTLKNLIDALVELLMIKPLEKVTIQELCDMAMISRGTFYNYFYDKYDLLNYYWEQTQLEIDPKFTEDNSYEKHIDLLLKNLIDYLSKEKELYQSIMVHNENSIFSQNMQDYIQGEIIFKLEDESKYKYTVPKELLATIYANIIITFGKWWLRHGENFTQEEVYKFFVILINHDVY